MFVNFSYKNSRKEGTASQVERSVIYPHHEVSDPHPYPNQSQHRPHQRVPEVVRQGVDSSLAHGFWKTKERVLQCFFKWITSGKQRKIQDLQRYAFSIDNIIATYEENKQNVQQCFVE